VSDVFCDVRSGSLRWIDHSSRGCLPTVVYPMNVIAKSCQRR
jgi:hypothetical protein